MKRPNLFQRRVRGFRVVEIIALSFLLILVLGVYLAKAGAGRERADIAKVESDIGDEQRRMKLLRAEVAYLEQPERIERLSSIIGLAPIDAKREAPPEALPDIARAGMVAAAPAPAAVTAAAPPSALAPPPAAPALATTPDEVAQ